MAALTPIEKLAVLLFTTYQFKSGEIYRGTEWTFTMNPDLHAMAAWKWSLLGRDAKDVWLALATQAKEFVAPEKSESAQGQLCAVGRETRRNAAPKRGARGAWPSRSSGRFGSVLPHRKRRRFDRRRITMTVSRLFKNPHGREKGIVSSRTRRTDFGLDIPALRSVTAW
jgi:hypothetical protein